MSDIGLEHVTKRFGAVAAIDDLTLEVADRELLVLLGPSGCGKSTVLRLVAGLEDPTSGTIRIGSRVVNRVAPKDRDVAMVFQTYALYPHMTVRRNIEFPLRTRSVHAEERNHLVEGAARALGITELLDRKPARLSVGQRQRVALARAIVRRPRTCLMDEPLSNLDAELRAQTRAELVELQRRLDTTMVYVTHDQVEAMTMAQRVAILDAGVLQQVGAPQAVYERPANVFVGRFIGSPPMNTVTGAVVRTDGGLAVRAVGGTVPLPPPLAHAVAGRGLEVVVLGVRPEHVRVGAEGMLPAVVSVVESLGHERHVVCRVEDGTRVVVREPTGCRVPGEGSAVHLAPDPAHLHLFDASSGRRVEIP